LVKKKPPLKDPERISKIRLGLRLKSFFWPTDRNSMLDLLDSLNYRDIEVDIQQINAKKSGVHFYFDHTKMVFGFVSKKFDSTISAQKDFFSVAKRDFNVDFSDYIRFYEFEHVSDYISEKNVFGVFESVYQDSKNMKDFEKEIGRPIRSYGVDLASKSNTHHDEKWYRVTIEPKVEGTKNSYFCRVIYRDTAINNIYSFGRKSSQIIKGLIRQLEY